MKFKLFAFTLALALATWAQTAPQNATPQTNPSDSTTKCACCEKMAGQPDAKGCCQMAKKKGKGMECCSGKQACCSGAQCTRAKADPQAKSDDPTAATTDKAGCGEKCCAEGKSCCGAAKGTETAMACCHGDQCPMHSHGPADQAK